MIELNKDEMEKLEKSLTAQVALGIVTETERSRILKRASGGIYLSEKQTEKYEEMMMFELKPSLRTLSVLDGIALSRYDKILIKTSDKLKKLISKINDDELEHYGQIKDLMDYNEEE
tara:strand:+ start:579 stop:929 length:351 start_codon:yes stop_codon:yes gene_type:complete